MKFHIAIPIAKALELLAGGKNVFEPANPIEAFNALMTSQSMGKKYYTGCDNENAEGRCGGHREES